MEPHADHLELGGVQRGGADRKQGQKFGVCVGQEGSLSSDRAAAGQPSSHIKFPPLSCRALACLPHREVTLAGRPGLLICQSVFSDPHNGFYAFFFYPSKRMASAVDWTFKPCTSTDSHATNGPSMRPALPCHIALRHTHLV